MYHLWDGKDRFPAPGEMKSIRGIEYINVHTAIAGAYQFLLGAAIIRYNGVMYASWGNSFRNENDNNTILAEKCSSDNGHTWTDYRQISRTDSGFGRSHGVYFEHKDKLYVFCPKARYDQVNSYPDLKMEAYVLETDDTWTYLGVVLDDAFWPMCEPIALDNGTLLMAGLLPYSRSAAVALCEDGDLTKWRAIEIPNPNGFWYWGETTVLKQKDKLLALSRGGREAQCVLVSESYDNGNTWSGLERSDLESTDTKMYAGTLANGMQYLVFNAKSEKYRETLCITVGNGAFERVYLIRHGFDTKPRHQRVNEWCYPYAWEDRAAGKLYVIYAKNKEDCELAIIPLESLEK